MANFDQTFGDFLQAWNRHQELKSSGADLGMLFDSRMNLDTLRVDLARTAH